MKATLIIFIGSGLGGVLRYFANFWISRWAGSEFPWGILTINVIGSLAIGLVVASLAVRQPDNPSLALFLTTGLIGGFTTFSAFSLDTALLYERGDPLLSLTYVIASVGLSVLASLLGMWMIRSVM